MNYLLGAYRPRVAAPAAEEYVATQARQVAWLDIVGFNGAAHWRSVTFYLVAGLLLQRSKGR